MSLKQTLDKPGSPLRSWLDDPSRTWLALVHTGSPALNLHCVRRGVLVDIVDVEGPILVERLFKIANKAAGNQRVRRLVRESMLAALDLALEGGRLAEAEGPAEGPLIAVVRTPDQPSVRLRAPGTRTIHEYPPLELTALISHVEADRFVAEEQLFRDVLAVFGSTRLAEKTSSLLRERRQQIYGRSAGPNPADQPL